jgi:hypothetical protein
MHTLQERVLRIVESRRSIQSLVMEQMSREFQLLGPYSSPPDNFGQSGFDISIYFCNGEAQGRRSASETFLIHLNTLAIGQHQCIGPLVHCIRHRPDCDWREVLKRVEQIDRIDPAKWLQWLCMSAGLPRLIDEESVRLTTVHYLDEMHATVPLLARQMSGSDEPFWRLYGEMLAEEFRVRIYPNEQAFWGICPFYNAVGLALWAKNLTLAGRRFLFGMSDEMLDQLALD